METFSPSGVNFNYENHNQEHLPPPSKDQRSPGRLAQKAELTPTDEAV